MPSHENPLDDVLVRIADAIAPALKATGHTPNLLTAYSALLGAGAVWALARGHKAAFAGLYAASYFFDCADGHFARLYDMETEFGDKFDHFKDTAVYLAILVVVLTRYSMPWWGWAIILAATMLTFVHLGCQQKVYRARQPFEETLNVSMPLCATDDPASWLPFVRWVGVGTMQATLVLVIVLAARRR